MRRKSNKIQFIALAFIMLFSVMNAWGLGLKTDILRLRQQGSNTTWNKDTKVMTWSTGYSNLWYVEPLSPLFENEYKGKDLYDYSKIIVKVSNLSQGAELRLVIASELEGVTTEYYYPIKSNGTIAVPLHEEGWKNVNSPNAIVSLYDMLKYAKTVRIGGLTWEGSVKIEEMYLCKDLECDANGNIIIGWEDLVANSDNLQRNGDFVKIDSSQKGWAGLGFSFDEPVAVEAISVDGSLYAGYFDGEQGFINNFAINYDGRVTSYPGKAWNTSYVPDQNYKMTGFEVVFGSTGYGTGHVKSVSLKLKAIYTVNFMTEGGASTDQPSMKYYGIPLTLPMPKVQKANSTFFAWTTKDGTIIRGYAGDVFEPYTNMNVNAKWQSNTIGSHDTEENTTGCEMYKIPNNSMREFTFHNDGTGYEDGRQNRNWEMWATSNSSGLPNNLNGAYFFMDLMPRVRKHIQANDDFWSNVETTKVYKQNGDNLPELTNWNRFMDDMRLGTEVTVKVYNANGKIRIYSVMTRGANTYVYPYEYEKYLVNNTVEGDVYVSFTVNHAKLTNFSAKASVPLAKLGFGIQGVDASNVMNHSDIASCSVEIKTPEGMLVPVGTMAGLGETYKYKAYACSGWQFVKWTNGMTENPRNAVISEGNIKEHHCSPVATFELKTTNGFQIAKNRVYYLDFENVVNADVTPTQGQVALVNESPADGQVQEHQKGRFYNYGNRGRIYTDPVFGRYYQNLAVDVNEFTESKSENFLRIVLTDAQKEELLPIRETGEATVGFWVNGRVANRYELPLERGSMFCAFSNDCFAIADNNFIKPRYMFDIACNGWTYSYMPNNDKSEYANDPEAVNKFFYGEDAPVVDNPQTGLFGAYYKHTQDQRQRKFYDDNEWHYVTYVADNGLKNIKMYLDGELTGTLDVTAIKNGNSDYTFFGKNGDYKGRINFIRNFVLGGFTPHGLFFGEQYYSDAALAYDEISVYSTALTQEQIRTIINTKKQPVPTEWHFTDALKGYFASGETLSSDQWEPVQNNEGIYKLKNSISKTELKSGSETLYATEHLRFSSQPRTVKGDIYVDQKKGLIGLTRGAAVYVPDVPLSYNVYFVAKPKDEANYPMDHFDLFPVGDATGDFFTRGVSLYGGNGKDGFSVLDAYKHTTADIDGGFTLYMHNNTDLNGNNHNKSDNGNVLWISDIVVSPYCLMYTFNKGLLFSGADRKSVLHVDVTVDANGNKSAYALPDLLITKNNSSAEDLSSYSEGNPDGNPYIRFSSSAPRVAYVDQSGNVTLTGLAGYAVIKAQLIFGNLHDNCISTAYEIRVTKASATDHVVKDTQYKPGDVIAKSNGNITMTMGGWAYTATYNNKVTNVSDSWSKGSAVQNDVETIDGYNTNSQGGQNAKNESYGVGNDFNTYNGNFVAVTNSGDISQTYNKNPWTLPCRGAYLKFEPKKAGVLTVYILQNGNLDRNKNGGNYSDKLSWRPIYIADETGKVIDNVKFGTNSKIFENDNFFAEGRRRAQFIEDQELTYNVNLKTDLLALKSSNYNRFRLLIDNWANAGWKQNVIKTEDGGYMVISKGLVRYSFNVYPGKTYYMFSNNTKIGYSGYNFEEGKLLNENVADEEYAANPVRDAVNSSAFTYTDGTNNPDISISGDNTTVTYTRDFTYGKWGSICLPFSMNNKQMKENFGEETSVVLLKGIDDKGVVQMVWHVNQDIIAGYPYFILPRGTIASGKLGTKIISGTEQQVIKGISTNAYFDPAVTAPSFVIGPEMDNGQSATYGSIELLEKAVGKTEYPYVFKGNFDTEQATAGSYVMTTSGVLTKASNTPNIKPFRAYLRYCSQIDASSGDHANGKPLTGMGYMNSDGEEVTTSIEQILEANGIFVDSANVYGVDGQVKRYNTHDLNGLPKGIYIVNGKKYVVK